MEIKLYDKYQDFIKEVEVSEEPCYNDYIKDGQNYFMVLHVVRTKNKNEFIVKPMGKPLKPDVS